MSVYFVTCRALSFVKIGVSDDPEYRLSQMQTGCPIDLALEAVIDGGVEVESSLHLRFAHVRVRGEWFHITAEIEAIISPNKIVALATPVSVGEIKNIRSRLGLTQEQMADHLGITQSTLSRFETGVMPTSKRTLMAALALCSVDATA